MLNTTLFDIAYDARLSIEDNPSVVGNLSNLVNQKMQLGTGNFRLALPFNSTEAGVLRADRRSGALPRRGAEHCTASSSRIVAHHVDAGMVEFTWQDVNEFGEGLRLRRVSCAQRHRDRSRFTLQRCRPQHLTVDSN